MLSTPPTKPSFVKYTGTVIRYKNMVLFHAALQDIIKDDYLWTFNNVKKQSGLVYTTNHTNDSEDINQ